MGTNDNSILPFYQSCFSGQEARDNKWNDEAQTPTTRNGETGNGWSHHIYQVSLLFYFKKCLYINLCLCLWKEVVMDFGTEFGRKLGTRQEFVALAKVAASSYAEANLSIIRYMANTQKIPGVYVTLNKPYATLISEFKREGIDSDLIIFIDAITKTSGGKIEKQNDCLFIGSPENLSDISLSMDQAVRAVPSDTKFIFFDSLNTLLLYNSPGTVAKFIHFLSGKMRIWKVKGIIVSLEKESNRELVDELTQFCDITIELGGAA